MVNKLNLFALFFTIAIVLTTPQLSYGSSEIPAEDTSLPTTSLWPSSDYLADEDKEIHKAFLGGKLIYRTNPNSDTGMRELPIASDNKPIRTFDLSGCGNTRTTLIITTDPSVFFKVNRGENSTVNVLIAPYFLIKKHIFSSAEPFKEIIENWNKTAEPIGIFWRWSGYDDLSWFDYVTSSMPDCSSRDLYINWSQRVVRRRSGMPGTFYKDSLESFRISF